MIARAFLLAFAAALVCAAPAQAHSPGTPADTLASAVAVGITYWAANTEPRPGLACSAPQVTTTRLIDHFSDVRPGVRAIGWTEDCKVQIQRSVLANAWARPRDRRANLLLCELVTHELGHAAGFEHSASGVMAPVIIPANAPTVCFTWARGRRTA